MSWWSKPLSPLDSPALKRIFAEDALAKISGLSNPQKLRATTLAASIVQDAPSGWTVESLLAESAACVQGCLKQCLASTDETKEKQCKGFGRLSEALQEIEGAYPRHTCLSLVKVSEKLSHLHELLNMTLSWVLRHKVTSPWRLLEEDSYALKEVIRDTRKYAPIAKQWLESDPHGKISKEACFEVGWFVASLLSLLQLFLAPEIGCHCARHR